jgi:hypothetical protein
MVRIAVSVDIGRSPEVVWADVQDIASHVTWMADAATIRFLTERTGGVGTRFECDTVLGPLRTTDVMEITAWEEGRRMGVTHSGLVTGTGEFRLEPRIGTGTRFSWAEDLRFPLWFGGPIGERLARPLLGAVWRRNLRRLKQRLEAGPTIT